MYIIYIVLDIDYVREHPEEVKQNILNRGADPKKADVDRLLKVDEKRRQFIGEIETLRGRRNELSKTNVSREEVGVSPAVINEGREIKDKIKKLEEDFGKVTEEYQELMDWLPNLLSPDTPIGKDAEDNLEIKAWRSDEGYLPKEKLGKAEFSGQFMPLFDFKAKDHVELGKKLDIIDLEQSAKVSGRRFAYLKNEAALLQFSLFELLKNKLLTEGFKPLVVPLLVRERALYGTSHFPADRDQVYKIENRNIEDKNELYLVGSSEPPIFACYMDKTLEEDELPQKVFAYSSCFRSEVGSWGKDVRGIKRVHQFDKLEMDILTKPEESVAMMDYLLSLNEWFLQQLKLPYHVILMCSGDAGYAATHKKYDVEVWLPSQKTFMEVMSDTNATDFQARRLNICYKDKSGRKHFVQTVNDTGCAMGRLILAILDNYQKDDGSAAIPEVLQSYLGKAVIKPKS